MSPRPLVIVSLLLALGCGGSTVPPDVGREDAGAIDGGPARTLHPSGRLSAEGTELVDATGARVILRGVNLGAWVFNETWMNLFDYPLHGRIVVEADRAGIGSAAREALRAAGARTSTDATREAYLARVEAALPTGTSATLWASTREAVLACVDVADDSDAPLRAELERRYGVAGRDEVLDAFQDAWITEADIVAIAERGGNLVRIPTGYRSYLDQSDADPITLPLPLRERAFTRLETLLGWCEAHGVYAILDLQESPGGHNDYSGPARLYEDPAMQEATIALWRAIAARFRGRDSVAAYSLLAEPFSAPSAEAMIDMYDRLHDALRADGDDHLLVIHDGFRGVGVLPVASEIGWTNVIYSTHLFEWGADSLADYEVYRTLYTATIGSAQARQQVPFFVGSFSVIHDAPWAYDSYALLTDFYAARGWSWSMWAWKRIDDPLEAELWDTHTAWGIYRAAAPAASVARVDLCHDDLAAAVSHVSTLSTANLVVNEPLDAAFRRGLSTAP